MPLERAKNEAAAAHHASDLAHSNGQDLMRGEHVVGDSQTEVQEQTGTSIFDPVLCELSYRWFCLPCGKVLDPFAGGSVRGVVASCLGLSYTGIELSKRQVEANIEQAKTICKEPIPQYNHAVLLTAIGSLPVRVGKQFESGRKLGNTHQHVLVFCKGDCRKAADAINGINQ